MSVSVFQYHDYKKFFNEWVENQPRQGFGEYRRCAQALGISTTMISQVFKGDKHLNLELASELCDYLNMEEEETDYFFLLVDYGRAGSHKLSTRLLRQIKQRQEKMKKLENRVKVNELNDDAKMIFVSSWVYQGVRMLADTGKFNNVEALATRLNLPRNHVQKILDFLIEQNLLIEEKNKLKLGPARTHLPTSSPLAARQLQNWRIQATSKLHQIRDEDFYYSAPMALSDEVASWIRQELPTFVEKINAKVIPSKSEVVRCLNIDWFEY